MEKKTMMLLYWFAFVKFSFGEFMPVVILLSIIYSVSTNDAGILRYLFNQI